MHEEPYTDLSIISAKYFLKFAGILSAATKNEEYQRTMSLGYVSFIALYFAYLSVENISHYWGNDIGYSVYCFCNLLCDFLAYFKVVILRIYRIELKNIISYAEKYFWHYDYDPQEQLIFARCQKLCKLWIIFIYCVPSCELFVYGMTPVVSNIGKNKSERELPLAVWVDWPTNESPYFELIFAFQMLCVCTVAIAYICGDTMLCILSMHVIFQFRILQHRMLSFWDLDNEQMTTDKYTDHCFASLKKCIQRHQILIEFCRMLEHVFTFMILGHIIIFSLLMGFECYILLSDESFIRRFVSVFHMAGSFTHVIVLSACCHGMMEESMNICETIYHGSWSILPMNKIGRSVRSAVNIIMMRSLRPCTITVGGFCPVTLETATTLFSSTFSYITLMRESLMEAENS